MGYTYSYDIAVSASVLLAHLHQGDNILIDNTVFTEK